MSSSGLGPVFKFGGTSMGSPERIQHVADLCLKHRPSAIVVSAMSGETNRLIGLGKTISQRTDVPEYDMLVASGEQVSVSLLSLALRERGIEPAPMLAPNAGILTDSIHSRAQILKVRGELISNEIKRGRTPVIAGFQGVTEEGYLTSLGRGGSDTSAVAIAAGIGAESCVIYTDVDGVFTTDPRLCNEARIIRKINFEEMLEMASQGSKVLHIRSVQLAAKWGIRLFVKNTFSEDPGTEMTNIENIEGEVVTGVAASANEAWLTVGPMPLLRGTLSHLFSTLAEQSVNVDIISQSVEPTGMKVSFTTHENDLGAALEVLKRVYPGTPVTHRSDVGKVSIVGVGMRTHAGVAARMFQTLHDAQAEVFLVTTSEIKVACLILRDNLKAAVNALHKEFLGT